MGTNTAANTKLIVGAECAQESLDLIRHVDNVGRASVAMDQSCKIGEERLFELENGGDAQGSFGNSLTLALAAFLPITAVLGFVGGSRLAKPRGHDSLAQAESI